MRRITLLACFMALGLCASARAQSDADGIRAIPEPNKAFYSAVQDARQWRNPYLLVRADGIEILSTHQIVSPDQVITTLARPPHKWPYGRVVAVQEIAIRSRNDDILIRRNLQQTLQLLKDAGVDVEVWPTA